MRLAPAALQDTHCLGHHVLWAMHKGHLLPPGTVLPPPCSLNNSHPVTPTPSARGSWSLEERGGCVMPCGCSGSASPGDSKEGPPPDPPGTHHLLKVDEVLGQRAIALVDEGHVCSKGGGILGSERAPGSVSCSLGRAGCMQRAPRAAAPTFEEEGDEGDDGGAQLGDGQAIDPVVPRRVLGTERELSGVGVSRGGGSGALVLGTAPNLGEGNAPPLCPLPQPRAPSPALHKVSALTSILSSAACSLRILWGSLCVERGGQDRPTQPPNYT